MKRKFLLAILSASLCLAALELFARHGLGRWYGPTFQTYLAFDKSKGWKPRPNGSYAITSRAKNFSFEVSMDGSGYRRDDGMKGSSNSEPAIVVLGDSNAFGFALDPDQTLSAHLAAELRARGHQGRGVLNAGCPGYDCAQAILRARERTFSRGQMYVFLVYPVNDLVNTANQIDYHAYKPFLDSSGGSLKIMPPAIGLAKVAQRFSPEFGAMNRRFELPEGKPTRVDSLCRASALAFTLKSARVLEWYGHRMLQQAITWDDMPSETYVSETLAAIRNAPLSAAGRFWPEILQFANERARLIERVGSIFAEAKEALDSNGVAMQVVLVPEPNRRTSFHRAITDTIQSGCPDFTFDWGSSASALQEEFERRQIPVICPQYDQSSTEAMFVNLDGHTTSEGFAVIAREIMEIYSETQ